MKNRNSKLASNQVKTNRRSPAQSKTDKADKGPILVAIAALEFVADNLPESTWRHLHQINMRRTADRLKASNSFMVLTEKQLDHARTCCATLLVAARKQKETRAAAQLSGVLDILRNVNRARKSA